MRKLVLVLAVFAAGCGIITKPPTKPPTEPPTNPPPGHVCEVGKEFCGCYVMPPETQKWELVSCPAGQTCTADYQCVATPAPSCPEACPSGTSCTDPAKGCVPTTPPPSTSCNPTLDPSMLPPLDNDKDWQLVSPVPTSTRTKEVNAAILEAQAGCPAAWASNGLSGCLRAGVPGIDAAFAQVASKLHAKGIKAGQPYVEGQPGKRVDALNVNGTSASAWEEWHLFYYGNGCLIGSPYKNTYTYTGAGGSTPPPVEPPTTSTCPYAPCPARVWTAETLPPGWSENEIGKPAYQYNAKLHTMGNADSTPVVIRQEPFCASIGLSPMADGTLRASCPVRSDGHPERVAVENWLLFGGPTRDSRNGQDCTPNNTDNPSAFLAGTGNCRMCNAHPHDGDPLQVCSAWF